MKLYWKTKSGERLLISKMKTSHIKNCTRLLEKYNNARLLNLYQSTAILQGDIAQNVAENGLLEIEENGFQDDIDDYIYTFDIELQKRNKDKEPR